MDMTPKQIVAYLDDYIIGQNNAKKTIALALRNRYRRMRVDPNLQEEIMPKNILMIGNTGVGKTEIARRLAKMMGLPFVKVEASKYTEVGFVGRDVESMIRDLVYEGMNLVTREFEEKIKDKIPKRGYFNWIGRGYETIFSNRIRTIWKQCGKNFIRIRARSDCN